MKTAYRNPGDGQLWQWQIESHVKLKWRDDLHRYECEHMQTLKGGKYERFYMRLTEPHPELGPQVREGAMCCECYRMLRKLNLAPFQGLWETITENEK